MVTALSLMTAVYWGQLSKCEITNLSIAQYSCDNKVAYGMHGFCFIRKYFTTSP